MKTFLKNNGLCVTFLILFILSIIGQVKFGLNEYNKELTEEGGTIASLSVYPHSGILSSLSLKTEKANSCKWHFLLC